MKKLIGLICVMGLGLVTVGCGDDDDRTEDTGGMEDTSIMLPDTNLPDTGDRPDTRSPDTGSPPMGCQTGIACNPDRGCPGAGAECIAQNAGEFGGAGDPIDMLPGGGNSIAVVAWQDGYCTPVLPSAAVPLPCDPDADDDPVCGDCASCIGLGGGTQSLCLADCQAAANDNDTCRDGYDCNLTIEVCFPGCGTDEECRVTRLETNGVDGLQSPDDCMAAPADCGGSATNFDRLTYDTSSAATCSTDTYRCEGSPSNADAEGGDPCTEDVECEAEGFCIGETDEGAWDSGYCTRFRCDIDGIDCAGDGVCQERGFGIAICSAGCTVADGADPADNSTWVGEQASARGGCREGYGCFWNGTGGAGVPDNGACVPTNLNAVAAPNVGGECEDDEDCWSPFGNGFCINSDDDSSFPAGYCSYRDCAAPGLPADVCGAETLCIDADGESGDLTICVNECATPEDCRPGYGCNDTDGDPATPGFCFDSCTPGGTDCRDGETCTAEPGSMFGSCR